MDRPHGFGVAFSGVGFTYFVAEFVLEGGEDGDEVVEALGGLFGLGIPAVCRHGCFGFWSRLEWARGEAELTERCDTTTGNWTLETPAKKPPHYCEVGRGTER
eukprot:scaffold9264_cov127-Skeletonema_dohrnii-CCMP3373.AAC.2